MAQVMADERMAASYEVILARVCPRCSAQPGDRCTTPKGVQYGLHRERRRA